MRTDPNAAVPGPHPLWSYFARAAWILVQATVWRLAWKRIPGLRPLIVRVFGGTVPLGTMISESVRVYFPWALSLGKDVSVGPGVNFYNLGGVVLGDRVVISQDVYFCGGSHDYTHPRYPLQRKLIVIKSDVWIGAGAFIGPGVSVGQGAVIGARAVVMKEVPPWKVVVGNPAREIKDRILSQ